MKESDRFTRAIAAFDAYHQQDPNTEADDGRMVAKELLYARRMTARLARFAPEASETAKLAARCQHIGRWEIPRDKYPMDKKGYLRWRNDEKIRHAHLAENILTECGYDAETIATVKLLLLKKPQADAETQLLEDVACLVFIEFYLAGFAVKHDDDKVVEILRKTLKKMSDVAKDAIRDVRIPPRVGSLIERATAMP